MAAEPFPDLPGRTESAEPERAFGKEIGARLQFSGEEESEQRNGPSPSLMKAAVTTPELLPAAGDPTDLDSKQMAV